MLTHGLVKSKYRATCITGKWSACTHRLPSVYFGPRLLLYLRTLDLSPALMLLSPPLHSFHFNLWFNSSLTTQIHFRFFFFILVLAGVYRPQTRSPNVLIPRWFFWACLNNLNVLNILSLSPLLIAPRQQKIPEPEEAAVRSPNVASFLLPLCFLPTFLSNFWHALGLQESHYFTKFPFGSWETEDGLWLTLCCLCRTAYSVRYRQVSKAAPSSHFYPECCPGWRRLHSHQCNQGNQVRRVGGLPINE